MLRRWVGLSGLTPLSLEIVACTQAAELAAQGISAQAEQHGCHEDAKVAVHPVPQHRTQQLRQRQHQQRAADAGEERVCLSLHAGQVGAGVFFGDDEDLVARFVVRVRIRVRVRMRMR